MCIFPGWLGWQLTRREGTGKEGTVSESVWGCNWKHSQSEGAFCERPRHRPPLCRFGRFTRCTLIKKKPAFKITTLRVEHINCLVRPCQHAADTCFAHGNLASKIPEQRRSFRELVTQLSLLLLSLPIGPCPSINSRPGRSQKRQSPFYISITNPNHFCAVFRAARILLERPAQGIPMTGPRRKSRVQHTLAWPRRPICR